CRPRAAGRRWPGPGRREGSCWRTTTTASSVTTAGPWARCRRSPRTTSSTPAPPRRASRRACVSAGSSSPHGSSSRCLLSVRAAATCCWKVSTRTASARGAVGRRSSSATERRPSTPGTARSGGFGTCSLHELDGGAGLLELSLDRVGLLLVHALLDRLRRRVDEVLGLLESEAGDRTDDLDHLDLLCARTGEHDVEGGLLLHRRSA